MRAITLWFVLGLMAAAPAIAQSAVHAKHEASLKRRASGGDVLPRPALAARRPGAAFADGFETSSAGTPPNGWVVENVNADGRAWTTIGAADNANRIHTGSAAAAVFWNADAPADDWLFSPGFTLEGGSEYRVSFWFKPGDPGEGTAESLEVSIGPDPTVAGMMTTVVDLDDQPAGDYREVIGSFTPGTTGTYHLGFHCNSAADQYFCAVDDVVVDLPPVGPLISVLPASLDFGYVANGASAAETVTITNNGSSELTIPSAVIEPSSVFAHGPVASAVPAGESLDVEITFAPSADGPYTGHVELESNAPSSPTRIALTGSGVTPPPNDNRAHAIPLSAEGTYTGANILATLEEGEPTASCVTSFGASVYWSYIPAGNGTLDIDLTGSDFDTVLTVNLPDGPEVGCNDDVNGLDKHSALIGLDVTAATTYLIRIGGYLAFGEGEGHISFQLTENAPVAVGDAPEPPIGLSIARPNPTAGIFWVSLQLATPGHVRVAVFDALGREVAQLHDGPLTAGETTLIGESAGLPAGPYIVRATGESVTQSRPLTVIR